MAKAPPSLPAELWRHVIRNLALRPLAPDQALPDSTFYSRQNALRQLCLSSRLLAAVARPYLYETIILYNADSLVRLTLLLARDSGLRFLVKNLALFLSVSERHEEYTFWNRRVLASLHRHEGDMEGMGEAERGIFTSVGLGVELDDAPALKVSRVCQEPLPRLMAALLAMTARVRSLLLLDLLCPYTKTFDEEVSGLLSQPAMQDTFLPDLQVLHVQAAFGSQFPPSRNYWNTTPRAHLSTRLVNLPRLRRLVVTCSYLGDVQVYTHLPLKPVQLEELNLIATCGLAPVKSLIGFANHLTRLTIDIRAPEARDPENPLPEGDLNAMLLQHAETLQHLTLRSTLCPSQHVGEQFGPLEKLTCLPSLRRLTHLTLEPFLLLDWLTVNTWPRFLRTLPPNLVSLRFLFVPEDGEDLDRIWARSGVGAALRAPLHKWQGRVPNLRHVHLDPVPFSPHAVEEVKHDLAAAGIALTWRDMEASGDLSLDFAGLSLS